MERERGRGKEGRRVGDGRDRGKKEKWRRVETIPVTAYTL